MSHSFRLGVATASACAVLAAPVAGADAREPAGIAFMCGRSTLDVCLARPDGSGRRQLTHADAVRGSNPFGQVTRGGSRLAFIHRLGTIRVLTLGGRRVAKIRTRGDPQTVELDSTGTRLLYTEIVPFDRMLVCRMRVGARSRRCFQSFRAYHAWGPAGTVISTEPDERSDVCVERRGRCARRIARTGRLGSFYGPAALSPDGRRLAVGEDVLGDPQGGSRIVTFSTRTGRRLRVLATGHTDHNPTWSPDGRWIAFHRDAEIRAPRPGTQIVFASLWRVPADGGRPRRITRRGYQPAWAG